MLPVSNPEGRRRRTAGCLAVGPVTRKGQAWRSHSGYLILLGRLPPFLSAVSENASNRTINFYDGMRFEKHCWKISDREWSVGEGSFRNLLSARLWRRLWTLEGCDE